MADPAPLSFKTQGGWGGLGGVAYKDRAWPPPPWRERGAARDPVHPGLLRNSMPVLGFRDTPHAAACRFPKSSPAYLWNSCKVMHGASPSTREYRSCTLRTMRGEGCGALCHNRLSRCAGQYFRVCALVRVLGRKVSTVAVPRPLEPAVWEMRVGQTSGIGNARQGQGVPDHQMSHIGGAQHIQAFCLSGGNQGWLGTVTLAGHSASLVCDTIQYRHHQRQSVAPILHSGAWNSVLLHNPSLGAPNTSSMH